MTIQSRHHDDLTEEEIDYDEGNSYDDCDAATAATPAAAHADTDADADADDNVILFVISSTSLLWDYSEGLVASAVPSWTVVGKLEEDNKEEDEEDKEDIDR